MSANPAAALAQLAKMLRQFRLDPVVAGSRMAWAQDWPLDRLMCAAADELDRAAAVVLGGPQEAEPGLGRFAAVDALHQSRQTNTRLNRRVSVLESAVRQMWDACKADGVRLSRRHDRAWQIVRELESSEPAAAVVLAGVPVPPLEDTISLQEHWRIVRRIEVAIRDIARSLPNRLNEAHTLAKDALPTDNSDLPSLQEMSAIFGEAATAHMEHEAVTAAAPPVPRPPQEPPLVTFEQPSAVCNRCTLTVFWLEGKWGTLTGETRCDGKDQPHYVPAPSPVPAERLAEAIARLEFYAEQPHINGASLSEDLRHNVLPKLRAVLVAAAPPGAPGGDR